MEILASNCNNKLSMFVSSARDHLALTSDAQWCWLAFRTLVPDNNGTRWHSTGVTGDQVSNAGLYWWHYTGVKVVRTLLLAYAGSDDTVLVWLRSGTLLLVCTESGSTATSVTRVQNTVAGFSCSCVTSRVGPTPPSWVHARTPEHCKSLDPNLTEVYGTRIWKIEGLHFEGLYALYWPYNGYGSPGTVLVDMYQCILF